MSEVPSADEQEVSDAGTNICEIQVQVGTFDLFLSHMLRSVGVFSSSALGHISHVRMCTEHLSSMCNKYKLTRVCFWYSHICTSVLLYLHA